MTKKFDIINYNNAKNSIIYIYTCIKSRIFHVKKGQLINFFINTNIIISTFYDLKSQNQIMTVLSYIHNYEYLTQSVQKIQDLSHFENLNVSTLQQSS